MSKSRGLTEKISFLGLFQIELQFDLFTSKNFVHPSNINPKCILLLRNLKGIASILETRKAISCIVLGEFARQKVEHL